MEGRKKGRGRGVFTFAFFFSGSFDEKRFSLFRVLGGDYVVDLAGAKPFFALSN